MRWASSRSAGAGDVQRSGLSWPTQSPSASCSGIIGKSATAQIGGPGLGSYNDGAMIDYFPVSKDGKQVGRVTSACYSPRLEKNIGYAMLPIELTVFGTELEVEAPTGKQEAVVVRKPFIDPKKDTPKQEVALTGAGEASHVD